MVSKREQAKFRNEIKIAEKISGRQEKDVWSRARDFYEGDHKPSSWDGKDHEFFSINLIFSNIANLMPQLAFQAPDFAAEPSPTNKMKTGEQLRTFEDRSNRVAAKLNSEKEKFNFVKHFRLGVFDTQWAFGMFKVYHKVREAPNPKSGEPKLKDSGEPITDRNGNVITHDETIPYQTDFLAKRVRPSNFLIDPHAGNLLTSADWCGERIQMRTSKAREIFDDESIEPVSELEEDIKGEQIHRYETIDSADVSAEESDMQLSVAYEIWDRKNHRKFYLVKGQENKVYNEGAIPKDYRENVDGTPYVPLKFWERADEFYPIPDTWNQIPANLEYDLARTQMNQYRKQFIMKMMVEKGRIDRDEMDKFQSDRLGQFIEVEGNPWQNPPARPMEPPTVPQTVLETIGLSQQDLQKLSGVSPSQQGAPPQNIKASQSIIAKRSQQSKSQWKKQKIREAGAMIGSKMSLLMKHRLKDDSFVVKKDSDGESKPVKVSPDDFQGDFNISVDFGSTGPSDKRAKRNQFLKAIDAIGTLPPILQHFDTRQLAEEFTEHFPVAKSALREEPDKQDAMLGAQGNQRNRGSAGSSPETQGRNGTQAPGPTPGENGVERATQNLAGGIG